MTTSFKTDFIEISFTDAACDAWLAPGCNLLVVSDANCLQAAGGEGLLQSLRAHANLVFLNFGPSPHADVTALARVKTAIAGMEMCLAIGSGTINDLCKLASFEAGIPYAVLPTAPSMNGYLSANASIAMQGYKQSYRAQVPSALLLNWQVLAAAPKRMIASGFADSLCRSTCWRDWYLSHLLLETPFDAALMQRLRQHEETTVTQLEGLKQGDEAAVKSLMEWLLEGGRAMTESGSSAPASQGEHMLAHWLELRGYGKKLLHGELIAITTLIMAALQERYMQRPPVLEWHKPPMDALIHALGQAQAKECLDSASIKPIGSSKRAEVWMKKLPAVLEKIRNEGHTHSFTELAAMLKQMELALEPRAVHIPNKEILLALNLAALTRDRFTFLDIAMFAAIQDEKN
jgi:glycerol-1-phosphate dehydrogenase [NAD(P)+]